MKTPAWLHPSGGLFYHYLAFRNRRQLWKPYIVWLQQRLQAWAPSSSDLVIIGASGGYTLNQQFLDRFKSITVIDPDPIAEVIFKRRFSKTPIIWKLQSAFSTDLTSPLNLTAKEQQSALLFSNILGQLDFIVKESPLSLKRALKNAIHKREFFSCHDRISFKCSPTGYRLGDLHCQQMQSTEELAAHFLGDSKNLEVIDHATESFEFQGPFDYFPWQIQADRIHIIEVCFNSDENQLDIKN